GSGRFLAVAVRDLNPDFQQRITSKGSRLVNANFLDAKILYREWSDDLNVHCSETVNEANRDLTMLLGINAAEFISRNTQWSGKIESLRQDISGAEGWDSLEHMFYVLNNAANYVVLNTDALQSKDSNITIQIATDDYYGLHTLLSNQHYLPLLAEYGGTLPVQIAGRKRLIGLRYIGDRFIDPDWMQELLINRVLDPSGYYRADDRNHFLITAYCALVLRSAPLRFRKFLKRAPTAPAGRFSALDEKSKIAQLQTLLRQELHDRRINHPVPSDPTACYNGLRADLSRARGTIDSLRISTARARARCGDFLAVHYWRFRDNVILFAPWISHARNALRSNAE
ncbi:MAG: hypothetical protein ACR2P6_02535, partial [Gammaproteobacteria bacterium]